MVASSIPTGKLRVCVLARTYVLTIRTPDNSHEGLLLNSF